MDIFCCNIKNMIKDFVPPLGFDEWRKKLNNVNAELIFSRNNRSWRINTYMDLKIEKYKLFLTEADIYNYIYEKDEYFWNKDIFDRFLAHKKYKNLIQCIGDVMTIGHDMEPHKLLKSNNFINRWDNTELAKRLSVWRESRMVYIGVDGPWKNSYGY